MPPALSEPQIKPLEHKESKCESKNEVRPTAIFFDWDDTLLSSSFLWSRGLRLDSVMDPNDTDLRSQLKDLETSVIALLKKASTHGKVHVITNGETGWVQRSAEKFIPAVVPYLANVDILSARSTYQRQFPDSPLQWKVCAFECLLKSFVQSICKKSIDVLSFGDSNVEREAVRVATRCWPEARTKSVKFAERPSLEQLRRQIELITNCFHHVHGHQGDLDLQLTITPHASSPASSSSAPGTHHHNTAAAVSAS